MDKGAGSISDSTPANASARGLQAIRASWVVSSTDLPTKLHSSVPQSFQVTAFNGDGIPAGATAITGNLTVTGQTAAGYVAITTTSQANPSTSTINFPVGDNRANGLTTPLGAGGKLWAVYKGSTSTATTQLVFDVTGYFSS